VGEVEGPDGGGAEAPGPVEEGGGEEAGGQGEVGGVEVAEGGVVAEVEAPPEGEGAGDRVGGAAQHREHAHLEGFGLCLGLAYRCFSQAPPSLVGCSWRGGARSL